MTASATIFWTFALVANFRFSNWVSGSSSFPFIFPVGIAYPGHTSLRSLVWRSKGAAACMCRIGCGEPCFPARFTLRSRHFRLHPQTSSGLDDPVRLGVRLFRSCRSSHLFLTEFGAINPHAMKKDGELTCDSNNGAQPPLGPHQSHSP